MNTNSSEKQQVPALERLVETVSKVCYYAGMVVVLAIIVLTFIHGVGRYVFNSPIKGLVELTEYGVIAAIFLVCGYGMLQNTHVGIDILVSHLPDKARAIIDTVTHCVMLAISMLGITTTIESAISQKDALSGILKIPRWPIMVIIAIGWLVLVLALLVNMNKHIKKYAKASGVLTVVLCVVAILLALAVAQLNPLGGLVNGSASLPIIGIVGLVVMIVLFLTGAPICMIMALVGLVGLALVRDWSTALSVMGTAPYASLNNYSWSTVPVFVTMGYLAKNTGLATDFFLGIRNWIGHIKGGLLYAVIIGNGAFGACCGDSNGAAVTFASITLPETRKYGYADDLTIGTVASSSLLSSLIPPSMLFIIYGSTTGTSIGKMFMSGIIPGILLIIMLMITVRIYIAAKPDSITAVPRVAPRDALRSSGGMLYLIIIFGGMIGGIYAGVFSPTEAGSFGFVLVLLVALCRRRFSFKILVETLRESGLTIAMVGLLLVGAQVLQKFLIMTRIPSFIENLVLGATDSRVVFLLIVFVIMLIMGMFIDALPMLLLVAPIFFPIAMELGLDAVHFGVVLSMMVLIGCLTPPVGVLVYVLSGMVKEIPVARLFKAVMPFLACVIVFTFIVMFVPQLSTWLPGIMFGT